MKTDPRPETISAVGVLTYTLPASLDGLTVTSVEGGTVTRGGNALTGGATLSSGDVLTFTPTAAGGTTSLNGALPNQEFSGNYPDLDNIPAGGGTASVTSVNTRTGDVTLSKADVGLGSVTNDAQIKRSEMGQPLGVPTLGADGKVPAAQLPATSGGGDELSFAPTLIAGWDSLTYGDEAGGPSAAWPVHLAAARNWTLLTNAGMNGSTLANGTNSSNPVVNRYATAVPADYDGHVVEFAGTNDYTAALPLGTPGTTNPGTVYGASLVSGRGILNRGPCFLHRVTPPWRGDIAEGTRNSAGYTMEQVRQVARDVVAQLAREFPNRVELIDLGHDLTDGLRATGMMTAAQLHFTAAGQQLIGQYIAMHATGADGTAPPAVTGYNRTFNTLTPGTISGQDGWTVYGGTGDITASGLDVAAPFDSQARGTLHALPADTTRVAMRLTTANFLAAAGNGIMLRAFHQLSDNRAICAWLYKASANPVARLDCGIVQGSNVAFWIGSSGPDIPSDDVWLEVLRTGGQIEVRMWDAVSGTRPSSATYSHADDATVVADAFGVSTIGPGTRQVKAVSAQ